MTFDLYEEITQFQCKNLYLSFILIKKILKSLNMTSTSKKLSTAVDYTLFIVV